MPNNWTDVISLAVVPVVIISACGLLCLTFYNRLAFIVTRLRALQRERLQEYKEVFELERKKSPELFRQDSEHYLHMLEDQTAKVLRRANLLRRSLFGLIFSIICFILTSFCIGLSLVNQFFDVPSIFLFVLGLLSLFVAMLYAFCELRLSLHPIEMESAFVQRLIKEQFEKNYQK